MLIGYARISTLEQTLARQQDALTTAGCERIFTDTTSGSKSDRPGLAEALAFARPGDTLVIWRLDRRGRSLRHLIDTVALLAERGIGLKSLHEQLDTTTSGGKLVFPVVGALAEFERDVIRERPQAGLAAARARGRRGGRPRALDPHTVQIAHALYHDQTTSVADSCRTLHISRATLYRYLSTGAGRSGLDGPLEAASLAQQEGRAPGRWLPAWWAPLGFSSGGGERVHGISWSGGCESDLRVEGVPAPRLGLAPSACLRFVALRATQGPPVCPISSSQGYCGV